MRVAESYHNIAELQYKSELSLRKLLMVHKVQFEDELEDSAHKRKEMPRRKTKNKVLSRSKNLIS